MRMLLALSLILMPALVARAETLIPVIELYTSQGCSSCPPADRIQSALAMRRDVIALTLPVDYWDYLGWKDTLASPAHTQRQKQWRAALMLRGIYTPQMVIGGMRDVVGSDTAAIAAALDFVAAQPAQLGLRLRADGIGLSLDIQGHPPTDCVLTLFRIGADQTVSIGRGENSGASVRYANPVRRIETLNACTDHPLIEINAEDAALAVVASKGAFGPQLGAAFWRRAP